MRVGRDRFEAAAKLAEVAADTVGKAVKSSHRTRAPSSSG
jgi:hypothetical protein